MKVVRKILFYVISFLLVIAVLELVGFIAMGLISKHSSHDSFTDRKYFKLRKVLMNRQQPRDYLEAMPQPTLNYIPTPLQEADGFVQHNYMGFRGRAVSLQKPAGVFRILFLGGSTTYGIVPNPDSTYPALTGKVLNRFLDSLPDTKMYKSIEVINAGLNGGTSAEELTHYLFKFRYFKPDLVVLHTGINDAAKSADNLYQPDYGNFFYNGDVNIIPLPPATRFLMRSYFLSFIIINTVYYDVINNPNSYRKTCMWFNPLPDDTLKPAWQKGFNAYTEELERDTTIYRNIPHPAFERNIETLISSIIADSTRLLLMPNAINPNAPYREPFTPYFVKLYKQRADENILVLKQLAQRHHIQIIPFEYTSISKPYWIDHCHLNEQGEREKALLVSGYLKQYLQ